MQKVDIATQFIISLASMVGVENVGKVTILALVILVAGVIVLKKKVFKSVFPAVTTVVVVSVLTGVPVVGHFKSLPVDKVATIGQEAFQRGLINNVIELIETNITQ